MSIQSTSESFQPIQSGRLFLILIILGIVASPWFGEKFFAAALAVGFSIALVMLTMVRVYQRLFSQPSGLPRRAGIAIMTGAIIVEVLLILFLVQRYLATDPRVFSLWVLLAGGVNLAIIGFARNFLVAVLGVLCVLNAVTGLLLIDFPFSFVWFLDTLLKIVFLAAILLVTLFFRRQPSLPKESR